MGADFEKEAIEAFFRLRGESLRKEETSHESKAPSAAPVRYSLIMQLQIIVDEQAKPYAAQDAKIRQLKDMAQTLAFCQENHIESREELESLLIATHEDYMTKKEAHAVTTAELKEAKEILNYTKQRHANKKIYLEFMNSKRKAKFRAEHEPEIILYEAATRELRKLLGGKPVPSEKKSFARIKELSQKKNEEYEELSEIKRREKSLQEKVNNVRSIFEDRSEQTRQKKKDQEL